MNTAEITVAALQKMFEEGQKVAVLDVRPQEQRDEWQIAGSYYIDAYEALNKGDNSVLNNLDIPSDVPVVTVCAAGRISQIAAEALAEKGYNALSLQGGMKAWNYAWNTAEIKSNQTTLIQLRRVAKGCLSYIVASNNEAIVIDASLEPNVYLELAQKNGWTIKYVMDSHVHADYISRTIELAKATGATHFFTEGADVEYSFMPVTDGQKITFGKAVLEAIHTPGHTPESISYLIDNEFLLTGDTLFTNGVGRPDLKANQEQAIQKATQLFHSLEKIKSLDQNILVLPAHTSETIAFDKKIIADRIFNLIEKIDLLKFSEAEFIEQTIKRIPPTPPNYIEIASLNKKGSYEGINPADLEAGANRCAVS